MRRYCKRRLLLINRAENVGKTNDGSEELVFLDAFLANAIKERRTSI